MLPNDSRHCAANSLYRSCRRRAAAPYSLLGQSAYQTFLGIPWVGATYTSSVVPVIFIIAFAAQIQNLLKSDSKCRANFLGTIFRLTDCFTCWVLDHWSNHQHVDRSLECRIPSANGLLASGLWIDSRILLASIGYLRLTLVGCATSDHASYATRIQPSVDRFLRASFAQTAVVVAMYFKLRDKKMKALCPPAIISGIFGVTEPAIYGITLPKRLLSYIL